MRRFAPPYAKGLMPLGLQPRLFRPQRRAPAAVPGDRGARDPNRRKAKCMTVIRNCQRGEAIGAHAVFPPMSRAMFAASYPEGAHKLRHNFGAHPLLDLEALAWLGEMLPADSVECHRGDAPRGADGKPGRNGLTIGETIREIADTNSWAVLRNIEQVPAYGALLAELVAELGPEIVEKTGRLLQTEGFVSVSSPRAVTPCHFDPEHHVLLQLAGKKTMAVFPAGHSQCDPDLSRENWRAGGGREPACRAVLADHGVTFRLEPGEAIYLPVMAPHQVRNGPEPSVSLSLSWRSDWSHAEADARAFNEVLRAWGFNPLPPGRWPDRNRGKSIAWRALRQLPGIN
jgi:hypothetical protein